MLLPAVVQLLLFELGVLLEKPSESQLETICDNRLHPNPFPGARRQSCAIAVGFLFARRVPCDTMGPTDSAFRLWIVDHSMRPFQYSLKVLMVVITVLCVVFAYPKLTATLLVIGAWFSIFALAVVAFLFALKSR